MSDPALTALARNYLPAAVAVQWSALQRPATRLRSAGPGEAVVAQLGGLPLLPAKVGWPRWKGEGWLNYVAAINLSGLPGDELDIDLPDKGRLLLFYRDPDVDDYQTIVEPETRRRRRQVPGSSMFPTGR